MKKLLLPFALSYVTITACFAQNNVGINVQTPDASAALDITSTTQGILVPRMNQAQRDGISLPATGLMIFQTDNTPGFYYNAGTPAAKNWAPVSASSSSSGATVFGDGSAGALNITANTNWTTAAPSNFNFQFSSITVAAGVTLTVPSGTKLFCSGNVSIAGTVIVTGSEKIIGTVTTGSISGVARTFAGSGDNISYGIQTTSVMSLINIPVYGGAGGASGGVGSLSYGGEGGGSFGIYAKGTVSISGAGLIAANGGNAVTNAGTATSTNGSGGGAGGIVVILSKAGITNSGNIRANGGAGSDATLGTGPRPGGGGGGGGVALLIAASVSQGNVQVNGGAAGNNLANAGNGSSRGGAGGGCAGNGGAGGILNIGTNNNINTSPTSGALGSVKAIVTNNPENLY